MQLRIAEIAIALDLPKGKIERWIRQGRIPLARREDFCTFDRPTLERWASQHNLAFRPGEERPQDCATIDETSLAVALQNGGVHYNVEGAQTMEVLAASVDRMACIPTANKPHLVEKLAEREALASTGIGKGIALPHPREPESIGIQDPAVAACFLAEPVDFQALDGLPVSILFILLSPSVQMHLQLLSRLSFCLRQEAFIAFLKQSPEPTMLISRLSQMEAGCDIATPRLR